jgi:hypothetical protein
MAEWLFNRQGQASIIFENDRIRNRQGGVITWVYGNSVYLVPARPARHAAARALPGCLKLHSLGSPLPRGRWQKRV